jgi:hypothetical protein
VEFFFNKLQITHFQNSSVFYIIARRKGGLKSTFRDYPSIPLSASCPTRRPGIKIAAFIGKGEGGARFPWSVTLANRVSEVWRTWKGENMSSVSALL